MLSPTDCRVFKKMFASRRLKPCLSDLIASAIGEPVEYALVSCSPLPFNRFEGFTERCMINCFTDAGYQAVLEMLTPTKTGPELTGEEMLLLASCYTADLFTFKLLSGKALKQLSKSYIIAFCSLIVFPERENFVNKMVFTHYDAEEDEKKFFTIIAELSRLDKLLAKPVGEMTSFEKWALFLQYAAQPEHSQLIEQIAQTKPVISQARQFLIELSQDERESDFQPSPPPISN
ncbi:MAG: Rpn family recombination-promoting nuclease/putative transposase [Deltaproteobacteria bacterium]|nr:Rpn family recombination-promoting nuclease/putative transposase [Deltaproteobacteria bacterium]